MRRVGSDDVLRGPDGEGWQVGQHGGGPNNARRRAKQHKERAEWCDEGQTV